MEEQIQLADEVWHRVVGIVQEAMLTGIDCADLLRQIRVRPGPEGALVLTEGYKRIVVAQHKELLEKAEALKATSSESKLIKGN